MLRITIELLPWGDESRKRRLGVCEIVNDATGTPEIGNYDVTLDDKAGRVEQFDRSRGAWELLFEALRSLIGDATPGQALRKPRPAARKPKTEKHRQSIAEALIAYYASRTTQK